MMYKNKQTGFSLVETLVAISILLVVIVGPMTLVVTSVRSTSFANDQVIASFLAQEGVEIVQAARDGFQLQQFSSSPDLSDTAWDMFTDNSGSGDLNHCLNGGCGLYLNPDADGTFVIEDCRSSDDNCLLHYDDEEDERARYTHDTSVDETKFTRVITIDDSIAGQAEVVSLVMWRNDGQRFEQEVEAVTYLFDIYGL